jgi:hypothetical protein
MCGFSVAYCYTIHSVYYSMTATVQPFYTIFEAQDPTERDAAFEIDELKDIVNHGMSAGVPMFIYTKDNVAWFNENEDTIEEYLSDWYFDNLNERNYMAAICNDTEPCSIDELKTKMVWMYVELKAFEILSENGYEF